MSCKKKYVMAVISMPIHVVDMESGDFECLQEYSTISIAECNPEILKTKKDNVYENMGEKIQQFLEEKETEFTILELEKEFDTVEPETKIGKELNNKLKPKNKTFRKFHSGRKYTLRNLERLGIN